MRPGSAAEAAEGGADRTRRCIATGAVGPAETRIRFVRAPDGRVVPDLAASLPGRGAWVVAERAPLEKAVARRLFARAFKAETAAAPDLAQQVERLLARRCVDLIGLARRAGQAVAGFGKVEGWARAGQVGALLTAREGAEDGRRRLYGLAAGAARIGVLDAAELGLAFGRESVVHAAVAPGRLADRLLSESRRLAGFRTAPDAAGGVTGIERGARSNLPDHDERPDDGERNELAGGTRGHAGRRPEPFAQTGTADHGTTPRTGTVAVQTARPTGSHDAEVEAVRKAKA
jgi:predicted RNA-binding protein YlxR (DUF448 family)